MNGLRRTSMEGALIRSVIDRPERGLDALSRAIWVPVSSPRMVGWTSLPWLWSLPHRRVLMGSDDPLVPPINGHILGRA